MVPVYAIVGLGGAALTAVYLRSAADRDEELRAWLQESHDIVGMQTDLQRPRGET
jgi:hypothetical protein